MQSEAFGKALDVLMTGSQKLRMAIMCAEAVPWRYHRSLIADAFLTRDVRFDNILSQIEADQHQLTSFAILENGLLHYPDPNTGPWMVP